jgi:hypothetical protein
MRLYFSRRRQPWVSQPLRSEELYIKLTRAVLDIHTPAMKNQELFVKTDVMDFGAGDLGFIWESDPAKRNAVAKKLLPAFSSKAIREKEPVVHMHMDLFVSKMKELGSKPEGLIMNDVRIIDPFVLFRAFIRS